MIAIYKLAEIVISRAGAGTVCELMALGKRSIFIPLKIAQKNEQYHNAMEAKKYLGSLVIKEDELDDTPLIERLETFSASLSPPPSAIVKENPKHNIIREIKNAFKTEC